MEPVEYLRVFRRRWAVVLAAAAIVGTIAWATAPPDDAPVETGTVYTARHTLLREVTDERRAQVSVERVALFATTGEVPRRVVASLGLDADPAAVATEVAVAGDDKLGTITFTATGHDPERAAALADAFATETLSYFDERAEQERQAEIERLSQAVDTLQSRVREFDVELRGLEEGSVDAELVRSERDSYIRQYGATFDRYQLLISEGPAAIGYISLESATAVPTDQPGFQAPSERAPRTGLGVAVGLVLGIALALVLERTDTRVRTRQGAEQAFKLPVLTEVPALSRRTRRRREVVTAARPASPPAEAYRMLRLSLQLMPRWVLPQRGPGSAADSPLALRAGPADATGRHRASEPHVVLLTSPGAGEGKTVTAANLAVTCAEAGKDVLLLDCDFRGGDLHQYFSCPASPGMAELMRGEGPPDGIAAAAQETGLHGVRLVPHGSDGEAAGSLVRASRHLFRDASGHADVVIVDSGPILAVNDPGALIPAVDAVVVVCRSGRTSAEAARLTTEFLSRLDAPVLGVVLTGVTQGLVAHSSSRRAHANPARRLMPATWRDR